MSVAHKWAGSLANALDATSTRLTFFFTRTP